MNIKDKYRVESIDKQQTYEWLMYKHYAKRLPSISYSFGLFTKNELVGVCTYGLPPSENLCLLCGEDYKDKTIELNRLIKNDGLEKNVQSYFVSQTFKLLPKPLIVVSYSDPNNGHYGYTYQALNFYYTGEGGSPKEYVFNNRQYHGRHMRDYWFKNKNLPFDETKTIDWNFKNVGGEIVEMEMKKRYVIFLGTKRDKKDMKQKLKWDILPYEKGDNKNYDTSHQTITQTRLF